MNLSLDHSNLNPVAHQHVMRMGWERVSLTIGISSLSEAIQIDRVGFLMEFFGARALNGSDLVSQLR